MATAKEHITEIIKRQPDDSSYDDIVRELAFDLMVQRGLNKAGRASSRRLCCSSGVTDWSGNR